MTEPYISVVVTARNDDHGGNLMGRMQAFVNGWLKQATRYGLDSELIIVEWNPPEGRPGLQDALRWPSDPGPCAVRIVQVPPELHRRYGHAAALPLYQMIGKNVGIRRARGKFVLATNIDILFSSELMRFFAERRLDESRMYRIDRHDVKSDVPIDAEPDEQQAYCDANIIRVNRREGTFPCVAAPEAKRAEGGAVQETLAEALPPELQCGNGWFPLEKHSYGAAFRWAGPAAEITVTDAPRNSSTMVLDIEPGPGNPADGLDLEITVDGRTAGRFVVQERSKLYLRADWRKASRIDFLVHNEIAPLGQDPRTLAFRALSVKWKGGGKPPAVAAAEIRRGGLVERMRTLWTGVNHLVARMEADAPVATFSVLVSPTLRRLLRTYMKVMSIGRLGNSTPAKAAAKRRRPLPPPAMLHTNACGDFTLAAREHWLDLRGYAEFDLYSMNLDSLFCYAAHHAGVQEEMLQDPMRIYHIEHGTGSGWTPEGQEKLYARLEAAGLSFVEMDTVLAWGAHMQLLDSPMIFNRENWGLGAFELPESYFLEKEPRT